MSQERLDQLVRAALQVEPERRPAFLDEACAGDEALRARAVALLSQTSGLGDESSYPGSDPALGSTAEEGWPSRISEQAPERLGPYRILGLLGQGGMGSVYRAERADGAFQGQVAIKFLRHGFESEELIRRFQAERQILAEIRHDHIARLLDAGTAPDGRPFFVLELVEGLPINRYCDE